MSIRSLVIACALVIAGRGAPAQDVAGSRDHPLLTRYPGAVITQYSQKAFDEFDLPLGKATDDGTVERTQRLEGKVTLLIYSYPEGRSVLEVFRNYEQALTRAGFNPLFRCAGSAECGFLEMSIHQQQSMGWGLEDDQRNLVARLAGQQGDLFVRLHVSEGGERHVMLAVVEAKPMEAGLVQADATALANELTRSGHASVDGIYFDTGKSVVRPESDAALRQIAALLAQNGTLKLFVVGHTDNVGDLPANLDLSRRRADAVVQMLIQKHGVAVFRLQAQGVGPFAPVATNDTDEGRGRNRRVELVKQ